MPWAALSAGRFDSGVRIWLASHDVYTLWIATLLHEMCGWTILSEQALPEHPLASALQIKNSDQAKGQNPNDFEFSLAQGKHFLRRLTQAPDEA